MLVLKPRTLDCWTLILPLAWNTFLSDPAVGFVLLQKRFDLSVPLHIEEIPKHLVL